MKFMVVEYSGMAIEMSDLQGITRETISADDNRVIFKFKPTLQCVKNPDTGVVEFHELYPVDYQSFVFDEAMDSAYEWWVNAWKRHNDQSLLDD